MDKAIIIFIAMKMEHEKYAVPTERNQANIHLHFQEKWLSLVAL